MLYASQYRPYAASPSSCGDGAAVGDGVPVCLAAPVVGVPVESLVFAALVESSSLLDTLSEHPTSRAATSTAKHSSELAVIPA
jgi:hypothetical protein